LSFCVLNILTIKYITKTRPPAQYDTTHQVCGLNMQVICIKCQKQGSLSLNHYTSHGHRYQYYGIQHYNRDTKKRHTRARDKIGQFVDCECFVEIERDRAMIIVSLKEYSNRVEHR
jgi:hypothetical protein